MSASLMMCDMTSPATVLLSWLCSHGVDVELFQREVRYVGPKNILTPRMRGRLKAHKPAIVRAAYAREYRGRN